MSVVLLVKENFLLYQTPLLGAQPVETSLVASGTTVGEGVAKASPVAAARKAAVTWELLAI
jgi:hypothetical protein